MVNPPDMAVDACVPASQQKLANPALDLAPQGVGWTGVRDPHVLDINGNNPPMIIPPPSGLTPNSAPFVAWFGGASGTDVSPPVSTIVDQLSQDITFAADATNFTVSGMILIGTREDPLETVAFDTFTIDITETNGTQIENVFTASNLNFSDVFVPFTKTLTSNLAGKTVRLRMVSVNDNTLLTNFFVDSLSFTATFCP